MEIFTDTVVFSIVKNIFLGFWEEPVGRIFLLTALAYSTSYIIYSSYISWFAGGYGGILLTQSGFTATDFLALFPTTVLLLLDLVKILLKPLIKFLLIYAIGPFALIVIVLTIRDLGWLNNIAGNKVLLLIGTLMYVIGMSFVQYPISSEKYRVALPIILVYLGSILLGLSLMLNDSSTVNSSKNDTFRESIIPEVATAIIICLLSISPALLGLLMASFAVKEQLLSQVVKLVLKEPVDISGLVAKKSRKQVFTYIPKSKKPVYLIASFSKVSAVYLPPETINLDRGRMLLIANEIIYSMEIEGRKKENENII